MRHKLTTFIIKNPPKNPKKSKPSKKTTGDSNTPPNGHASPENGEDDGEGGGDSDDELTKRIKAEAADLNADSKLAKEDWSVDTSEEAVKARTKAAESLMANLALGDDDDDDDDADSPYKQLGFWAQDNRDAGPVEIYKKAEELGIAKKHKSVQVLVQSLFDENIVKQIAANAPLFKKVRRDSRCP